MGTAGLNFMQGMATVQAMQQSQEAHEQQLEKNEQAMRLADAQEERLQRQDNRAEQEAYRNQVAFDAKVGMGQSRVRSWNGRDKPAWASAGLGRRYDDLDVLNRRIRSGQQRGDDMTADIMAFTALSAEYDQMYQSEVGQRHLSNNIGELEGIYEATGLEPDAAVAGLIENVRSQEAGLGYTQAKLTQEERTALNTELSRARQYAEDFGVRRGLKSDLDAMREVLQSLRAGKVPEGFENIDDDMVKKIQQMRINGPYDDDDDAETQAQASTLKNLVELLDPSNKNAINVWDPDQDVSVLQDRLRTARGLFDIIGSSAATEAHDLQLNVQKRMEQERQMFAERNSVAELVRALRRENPDGPMSPVEQWAERHYQNVRDNGFSLDYDNDTEYLDMWAAVEMKARALGGDKRKAIVAMSEAWRNAEPKREKWRGMQKRTTMPNPGNDYDAEYYGAYVDDILASEQQLEQEYSSKNKTVDSVVNLDIRKTEKTPHASEGGTMSFDMPYNEFVERSQNAPPDKPWGGLSDKHIQMISDRLDEKSNKHYGAVGDVQALSIALKQAGVSRAEYYGFAPEDVKQGFDPGVALASPAIVPIELAKGTSLDELDEMMNPRSVTWRPTRTTFREFAQANPKAAAKILFALENPDPAWVEAEKNPGGFVGEGWAAKTVPGAVKPGSVSAAKRKARVRGAFDEALEGMPGPAAARGLDDARRGRNMEAMRGAYDDVEDTLPADRREALVDSPTGQAMLEGQMLENLSGGRGREDMVFPELPPETTMLEDVYQGGQVGTQQRDFPGRQPVSMDEAMGEQPQSNSEKYAESMADETYMRELRDRTRVVGGGDIPQDTELTRPLSYDDDSDRPNPRTPSYDMEGLDDLEGERAGVADVQETYSELSRTRVNDVKEDPIYKTAAKHAKTKRLEEVERLLAELQQRRSKSGDGKLTRKDAAMFAALIDRRRRLRGARRRK